MALLSRQAHLSMWMSMWTSMWMVALASGCLFTPPEELDPSIGAQDTRGWHHPGEPCLLCHGPEVSLPKPLLYVAGTVYDEIDSQASQGVRGVEVIIVDADDRRWRAVTSRSGNFSFSTELPYPLTVEIRRGDVVSTMQTRIWRNGSCAHCHGAEPGEASVGRVFLDEEMSP